MRRISTITALALGLGLLAADAAAIIGRPLTPMSYAGVARRTVRRTAYVGAATYGAAVAAPYAAPVAAPVATLPAGCTPTGPTTYTCGTQTYQPYYQGTQVVYAPAP